MVFQGVCELISRHSREIDVGKVRKCASEGVLDQIILVRCSTTYDWKQDVGASRGTPSVPSDE